MTASTLIPRTCTEIVTDERDGAVFGKPVPLSAYRDVPAYVLLGEPGAGKTTEFEQECRVLGTRAEWISARRFAKADIASHPEWRDKVLFIDGLDETRAGARDATTALDEIQSKLDALGQPRFRISCRAADWLGPVDRRPLAEASPDGAITTLRLDALDRSDVRQYLKAQLSSADPVAFILEAESLGLGPMLDNPLTLNLLTKTTGNDGLPSTRREAFERSCRTLAQELNPEHPRSAHVHPPELTLVAAGRLCAIQLLTGKDGYSLAPPAANSEFIPLVEVAADIAAAFQGPHLDVEDVFATSLFVPGGDRSHLPMHRQIAEYLAAAHIADLIEAGTVSLGRVRIALTSPVDDRIVTDLRGLAAWLSTLSSEARREFIASDPVGVAIYGDIAEWPFADRHTLLEAVVESARPEHVWGHIWFDRSGHRYRHAIGWSFRSLCKPDMAPEIGDLIDADRRNHVPDHVQELLLQALSEAEDDWLDGLRCLVPRISRLALDVTTQPDVRLAALLALARIERFDSGVVKPLGEVLVAVRDGTVADPDGRIRGPLLRLLYPRVIEPSEIWAYAPHLRRGSVSSEGWDFWRYVLCDETPIEQLPQLLDGFADDAERLWPMLSSAFANEVPLRLLNRALREVGREIKPEQLYRWIVAVVANYERRSRNIDETAELSGWLAANERVTLQLRSIWIARSVCDEARLDEKHFLRDLLLADYPEDFATWCIRLARERQRVEPEVARAFVREAYYALPKMREQFGMSLEGLRAEIGGDDFLTEVLDSLTSRSSTTAEADRADARWRREFAETEARLERERRERQRDWSVHLRNQIQELRNNSFSAPQLDALASAYFGFLIEVNDDNPPMDRIADLIGDDAEILEAVADALRNAPIRADVPSVERTAELTAESKHDWLAYPVLAGLAIRQAEGSLDSSWLSSEQRCQAVAIAATAHLNPGQQPSWAVDWLHQESALVLDVLHRCAVASIRKGDTHLSMLNWLLEVNGLDDEMRDFRLGLLRSMSVRIPRAQLQLFDYLVGLVLQHPDSDPLVRLATRKLASISMTDAQRVRWLTLAALLGGREALNALDEFIQSKPASATELAPFLSAVARRSLCGIESAEDTANVAALIAIVGRAVPPRAWGRPGDVVSIGPAEEVASLVSRWIDELGSQPTADAGAALDALMEDDRLSAWHSKLEYTREQQGRLHSDAAYAPMGVAVVLDLLRNGPPAKVADLHALLEDHLRDLGGFIRGDNSDPWRDFWEDERSPNPYTPRHEETCRDAILRMLRSRPLPEGVVAEPEGDYASDKRCDIDVRSTDFKVPIEVKKNVHRDLWTAISDQLIAKYAVDPETGGYGIYLVLWFGAEAEGYPRNPTTGNRPETPDELERMLDESLSHDQRRRVGVVVLDVTKP